MAIEFRCSQCNQLLRVPDSAAGKNARCPKCQALMMVPAATTSDQPSSNLPTAPSALADLPPPPFAPSGPSAPLPPPPPSNPFSSAASAPPEPPKPSSEHPFGEPGGSPFGSQPAGGINPYASPAGSAYGYSPQYFSVGGRPGLPWENERQTLGCWFRTMGMILSSPTQAFSVMRQYGGLGTPMIYSIYGMGMPLVAAMVLIIPIVLLIAITGGGRDAATAFAGALIGCLIIAALAALYVLMLATIGAMISAAIYHVLLMIVGGARQGYETTFRVVSYTQGSLFWLVIIPYLGPTIMGIWSLVLFIIGLSRAHEISGGKAALAIFLPLIVCIGALMVGIVIAIAVGVLSNR